MKKLHFLVLALGLFAFAACGDSEDDVDQDVSSDVGSDTGLDVQIQDDTGEICTPDCTGRVCGGDGCGGTCGTCGGDETCNSGVCEAVTQLDCLGILMCLNEQQCQDATCVNECISGGDSVAQSDFMAMSSCINRFCASETTDAGMNACVMESCAAEYGACTGESVPDGDASCAEVFECLPACLTLTSEAEAQACGSACLNSGSVQTASQAANLADCAIEAVNERLCTMPRTDQEFIDCAEAQCPDLFLTCYPEEEEGSGEEGSGEEGSGEEGSGEEGSGEEGSGEEPVGTRGFGEECDLENLCVEGLDCEDDVCVYNGDVGTEGDACEHDYECEGDLQCDDDECAVPFSGLDNGEPCSDDSECASGFCLEGEDVCAVAP